MSKKIAEVRIGSTERCVWVEDSKLDAYVSLCRKKHNETVDQDIQRGLLDVDRAEKVRASFSPAAARRAYLLAVLKDLCTQAVNDWPDAIQGDEPSLPKDVRDL